MLRKVSETIRHYKLLPKGGKIVVGLSGGADSVALLHIMLRLGYDVEAVHCNFHLRGAESDRDEQFAADLCRRLGVRLHAVHFRTAETARERGVSVEMQARDERYACFERIRKQRGDDCCICVGHHRDDNNETMLLNLARGTGISGLRGMRRRNGNVVRPLLDVSRQEIEDWLREIGETYVTDSTNADTCFRRNLVRHELLPVLRRLNPAADHLLAQTAGHLAEQEIIYRTGLAKLSRKMVSDRGEEGLDVSLESLVPHPAAATLLHEWLAPYGFNETDTQNLLKARTGARIFAKEWIAERTRTAITVRPIAQTAIAAPGIALSEGINALADGRSISLQTTTDITPLKASPLAVSIDADSMEGTLRVRNATNADRFQPFGMKGTKLVSDYLTDRHRSRYEKQRTLVVCDDQGIVWLVGERIAARCALNTKSERALRLTFEQ